MERQKVVAFGRQARVGTFCSRNDLLIPNPHSNYNRYSGLLSAGYYLDHMHPALNHYKNDPLKSESLVFPRDLAPSVLGGEACMWSEYVSSEILDSKIWPRMAGIAERYYSVRLRGGRLKSD